MATNRFSNVESVMGFAPPETFWRVHDESTQLITKIRNDSVDEILICADADELVSLQETASDSILNVHSDMDMVEWWDDFFVMG